MNITRSTFRGTSSQSQHARCFASTNNGGDNNSDITGGDDGDDDEDYEWMPPDDSPLVANKGFDKQQQPLPPPSTYNHTSLNLQSENSITKMSPGDVREDEVEVIDLEATLNNQHNQQIFSSNVNDNQIEATSTTDMSSSSSSDFDVEMDDVGWTEILRELKHDGKTDMMERLVHEYNLQDYLDTLDDDTDDDDKEEEDDDEVEWDEEFDQSLEGLTIEEVIDEIIENSPSFTELEMEILSQEMDTEGIDYDSLEDVDLSNNSAYTDFRAMVLEDYHEKKNARGKTVAIDVGKKKTASTVIQAQAAETTNWSTKSDFSDYPHDWTDFDSKAAFKKDFSEDNDSWEPPSSQFVPFQSSINDTKDIDDGSGDNSANDSGIDSTIDWLQARRSRLGESKKASDSNIPTHLLTPKQAESFRHQNSQIEVIPHTLFTTAELEASLAAQGATDIHVIDTSKFDAVHGAGIGCNYMMLVTGRNASHIRVLADSCVKNLKRRRLNERNVIGASLGAEGGEDIFSNKQSRNRARRNGAVNISGKVDDDWIVVDCENIHVHILEETTRKCLNIEGLWDLSNPHSDGSVMRRIDLEDDDAIDSYVANNPIPDHYAASIFGGTRKGNDWISGGDTGGRVHSITPSYPKKSFSAKWSGNKSSSRRGRRSKK